MSYIDFKPTLESCEYASMRWWIENTKGAEQDEHINRVKDKLYEVWYFVNKVPCDIDFGEFRRELFIPFGGPNLFNRWVALMIEEIKLANDRTCDYS